MKLLRLSKTVKWGCIAPVSAFIALILAVVILNAIVPSSVRRALPSSATEIQEYYDASWNGDFVRLIKARLPESDYPEYARRLGLSMQFDSAAHGDIESFINMGLGEAPWWDPPGATTNTYFAYRKGDDYLRVLNYKSGFVYFGVVSW